MPGASSNRARTNSCWRAAACTRSCGNGSPVASWSSMPRSPTTPDHAPCTRHRAYCGRLLRGCRHARCHAPACDRPARHLRQPADGPDRRPAAGRGAPPAHRGLRRPLPPAVAIAIRAGVSAEDDVRRVRSLLLATGLLATCASQPMDPTADLPPDAVPTTRTEANGDVITEYRVAGQLRVVRVEPSRGPVYYLYDRNRDGLPDEEGDNPPQTYFKLFDWN